MPAITVGFPEFEARLETIRRRLNLLSLQDAACLAGTALLLAVTASWIAASTTTAQVATWIWRGAIATTIVGCSAIGLHLYRQWLTPQETAILVDRRADLDARLATLLAHPSSDAASPLRSMLLMQVFELAPRWRIELVAPRRVGKPAIACAGAILIFLAALWWLPTPEPEPPPETAVARAVAPLPTDDSEDGAAHPAASTGRSGSGQGRGGSSQQPGHDGDTDVSGSSDSRDGDAAGALGSKQLDAGDSSQRDGEHQERGKKSPGGDRNGKLPPPPDEVDLDELRAKPELEKETPDTRLPQPAAKSGTGRASDPARKAPNGAPRKGGAKAGVNKAGVGPAATKKGVLGDKAAPLLSEQDREPMLLELKAFVSKPVMETEPQGRDPEDGDGNAADGGSGAAGARETASGQLPNAHLTRSSVTRAHQDLVRDLFTPTEQ